MGFQDKIGLATAAGCKRKFLSLRAVGMVVKMLSVLGLAPFHHDAGLAGTAALNTMGMAANILVVFFPYVSV